MSDLRTRIANIVADHQLQYGDCYCGERFQAAQPWGVHVADAVIAELGLEKQSHYDPGCHYHRWVTDWKADDE